MKSMRRIIIWLLFLMSAAVCIQAAEFETRLTNMDGTVSVQLHNEQEFIFPELNMLLETGDQIKTGEHAQAELMIDGEGIFFINEKSIFTIGDQKKDTNWFELAVGSLLLKIENLLTSEERLDVRTKTMVVGIRGTEAAVEVEDDAVTHVGLFEGVVEVSSLDSEKQRSIPVVLHPGQQTKIAYLKPPLKPFPLSKRMLKHKKNVARIKTRFLKVKKKWHQLNKKKSRKIRQKIRKKIKRKKIKRRIRPKKIKKIQEKRIIK